MFDVAEDAAGADAASCWSVTGISRTRYPTCDELDDSVEVRSSAIPACRDHQSGGRSGPPSRAARRVLQGPGELMVSRADAGLSRAETAAAAADGARPMTSPPSSVQRRGEGAYGGGFPAPAGDRQLQPSARTATWTGPAAPDRRPTRCRWRRTSRAADPPPTRRPLCRPASGVGDQALLGVEDALGGVEVGARRRCDRGAAAVGRTALFGSRCRHPVGQRH